MLASWFHYLCKSIRSDDFGDQQSRWNEPTGNVRSHGDWTWLRTSVFMRWVDYHDWDKARVAIVIFSAPPRLKDRCKRIWTTEPANILTDPFSLFVICLDELWLQSQGIVRIIGDELSKMEDVSLLKNQQESPQDV